MTLVLLRWNTGPSGADCVPGRSWVPSCKAVVLQSRGCLYRIHPLLPLLPCSHSPLSLSSTCHALLQQPWEVWQKQSSCAAGRSCRDLQGHGGDPGPTGGNAVESPAAGPCWPERTCSSETLWVSKGFRALQLPALPGHVPHRSVATLPGLQCSGQLCLLLHPIPASETL